MLPAGVKLSGFPAWFVYLTVHLVYLSGFRTRVRVFLSWIWSYLTWARGARLIPSMTDARAFDEAAKREILPLHNGGAHQPAPPSH
jgi:NADH dehydrogenase